MAEECRFGWIGQLLEILFRFFGESAETWVEVEQKIQVNVFRRLGRPLRRKVCVVYPRKESSDGSELVD